jgi:putative flippase GtrA
MSLARYLLGHSFIRFALIGGIGYVVDTAVLAFGTDILKLDFEIGRAFSIFAAMCFTWAGNRYFTFADRRARGFSGGVQEWLKFVGANLLGAVVNYSISVLLVRYAPFPLNYKYAAQAAGVLVGLVFNFTLSRTFVFKSPSPPV